MAYRRFVIELQNRSETLTLPYLVHGTDLAQLWADRVRQATDGGLLERDRFYNFDPPETRLAEAVSRVRDLVSTLQTLHPEIPFGPLDFADPQAEVNRLHHHFAHGRLVETYITPATANLWEDFNVALHRVESVLQGLRAEAEGRLPRSRIVVTWKNPQTVDLPPALLKDFRLSWAFGACYMNYCQTGRQIFEMFSAGDDGVDDAHIQPASRLGANVMAWFGESTDADYETHLQARVQEWFAARAGRFAKLGLRWGDDKLALGSAPVAILENAPQTRAERRDFLRTLARFTEVRAARVF